VSSFISAAIPVMGPPGDLGDGAGYARVVVPMRSQPRGLTGPPIARPAMLARAISLNGLPGLVAKTSGAAPRLVAGNATAVSLIAGAAAVPKT
jgi:hypothetical protein